jgi:RNA-directed DNA polymerase
VPLHPGEGGETAFSLHGEVQLTRESADEKGPRTTDRLMEEVADPANLNVAWNRVRANRGAPGIDGVTVEAFPEWLAPRRERLRAELLEGSYRPQPLRRVKIPKPNGGERLLGIPTVLDRLVQQAILQVLQPILDPSFSEHSYGFRPGRNAHQAVFQAQAYIQQGYDWVVDIDLEAFFDRVNHDRLMSRLSQRIADKRLRWIIRGFLRSGVMEKGVVAATMEGTPQGGPLSPLLANYVLDELDKELEERGLHFVRYADDANVYVRSERAAERAFENLTTFLEGKLKLKVNRVKSAVGRPWERKLLGFSFSPGPDAKRRIAPKALEKLKAKVRKMTRNGRSDFRTIISGLKLYLTGWRNYFGIAQTVQVQRDLDSWIRRRLRALIWRRWKTCARRRRGLRERDINPDLAGKLSGSSLGSWPISRMMTLHYAFPTQWFTQQGLPLLAPAR